MNVLVLGGTRFLGRHIVDRLAADGHRVVCFHRGETCSRLPAGVEERYGDRNTDLDRVATESWDAIVDTCCYRPEQMQRSLELRTDRYVMISTVNVYADLRLPGTAETAPLIEEFDPSDEAAAYGGNKAACERLVMERYPRARLILRPGLIAGRWDPTGRFTYWCERLLRGGRVLAPGEPNRLIQFVDASDIAAFIAHALSHGVAGDFNMVGPAAPTTMATFIETCAQVAASRGAPPAQIVWTDETFLLENGVEPWRDLPLWLTDLQYAGILALDNGKALAAGFTPRPIAETIRAVLDWLAEGDAARTGLAPEREAELLNARESRMA